MMTLRIGHRGLKIVTLLYFISYTSDAGVVSSGNSYTMCLNDAAYIDEQRDDSSQVDDEGVFSVCQLNSSPQSSRSPQAVQTNSDLCVPPSPVIGGELEQCRTLSDVSSRPPVAANRAATLGVPVLDAPSSRSSSPPTDHCPSSPGIPSSPKLSTGRNAGDDWYTFQQCLPEASSPVRPPLPLPPSTSSSCCQRLAPAAGTGRHRLSTSESHCDDNEIDACRHSASVRRCASSVADAAATRRPSNHSFQTRGAVAVDDVNVDRLYPSLLAADLATSTCGLVRSKSHPIPRQTLQHQQQQQQRYLAVNLGNGDIDMFDPYPRKTSPVRQAIDTTATWICRLRDTQWSRLKHLTSRCCSFELVFSCDTAWLLRYLDSVCVKHRHEVLNRRATVCEINKICGTGAKKTEWHRIINSWSMCIAND